MTRIGLLPALAVMLAAPLAAQQVNPAATGHGSFGRGLVHYGKWVTAGLAATLIGLGAREHATSDGTFTQLIDRCHTDPTNCALDRSGAYVNPISEYLYQTSLHYDQRARNRLFLGQAGVLLAAGLFLADRGAHANGPDNIPYHGLMVVEPMAHGARVGVRVRF
jgi:hypothetical protein